MKRNDLIRDLRAFARKRNLHFEVDKKGGKGSHYRLTVGERKTIIPTHLSPNLIRAILKQLMIDPAEL